MKSINILASFLAICILTITSSCNFFGNCVEGIGENIEQEVTVGAFTEVKLSSSARVYIKQGPEQRVTIDAPQNIIDLLKTKVNGSQWEIEFERCISTKYPIDIYIQTQDIESLIINGSGEIVSEGELKSDQLELEIDGSGSMNLNLMVKELNTDISGSGDISLKGTSKLHEIEINGSGDIMAYELITDETKVEINGSGDVKVNVSYALNVEINGSGDVYYKGNVKEMESDINGSGKLHQEE